MPNHITNRLTIVGPVDRVAECLAALKNTKGEEEIAIDFDNIKPMPEELNLQMHSGVETACKYALKMRDKYENSDSILGALIASNKENSASALTFNDKDWADFITGLNNAKKYGHVYWYDWRNEHWGTKWGAYAVSAHDNVIQFDTAWSGVTELMTGLSKQWPDLQFDYMYADEDSGSNTGTGVIKNGVVTMHHPESQSDEAYQLYFELYPGTEDDFEKVDGKYQYKDSED